MLALLVSLMEPNAAHTANARGDIYKLYFFFYILLWFLITLMLTNPYEGGISNIAKYIFISSK